MKRHISHRLLILFFLLLIGLEIALQSVWLDRYGLLVRPLIYMGIATSYGFYMWYLSIHGRVKQKAETRSRLGRWWTYLVAFAALGIFVVLIADFQQILADYVISPMNSDVIPALQLYIERLRSGTWVYAPMEFPGWTVIPNYLPMVWLPFIIPDILEVDYRWLPLTIFVAISFYNLFIVLPRTQSHPVEFAMNALAPFILLYILVRTDQSMFGHTVELLIVSYYLLLCKSILSPKLWWAGLGILLCLMSRYSFGLWLPMYFLIFALSKGWSSSIRTGLWVLGGVFLIYIIPFVFQDPMVYFKGMSYYDYSAQGEWVRHGWQEEGARPYHLSRGFGFAIWVYDWIAADVPLKIKIMQTLNLITSLITVLVIFAIYWWNRKRIKHLKLFLIFALKIYLMVFYSFIHVPYAYLHILPLLLIIPLLNQLDMSGMINKHEKAGMNPVK